MKRTQIAVVLLSAAALMACGGKSKRQGETAGAAAEKVLIATAKVTSEVIDRQVQFSSSIEPNQKNNISGIAGRIDKINVRVGDHVQRGQLLVVMDQTQYTTTMVQLADLEQNYDRMKTVFDAGGVSQQQLDQMEAQLKVLRETAANLKDNTELLSPIDGVVTARNFDPGDQAAGMPVLQVMEIGTVKVISSLSEQYFPLIKLGLPVDITVDVLPGKQFKGRISLIYPTIDPTSRTFKIEVSIPNGGNVLRPGMFSRSSVNLGKVEAVLAPDLAVQKQTGTNERYVFVIEGDSVARRRVVQVGEQLGDRYIVDSGLTAGEAVAVTGPTKLIDGTPVKVKDDATLSVETDTTK